MMSFLTKLAGESVVGAVVRYALIGAGTLIIGWLVLTWRDYQRVQADLEKEQELSNLLRGQVSQLSSLNEQNLNEFDRELERRDIILESVQRTALRERNRASEFDLIDEGLRDAEDYDTPVNGVLLDTINELRRIRGLPPIQRTSDFSD